MSLSSDVSNQLPTEVQIALQGQIRKLEQEIMSKAVAYDILQSRSEMLQKRLETKELRIKNLTADLKKLQSQLAEKNDSEVRLAQTIQDMQEMQENIIVSPIKSNVSNNNDDINQIDMTEQQIEIRKNVIEIKKTMEKIENGMEKTLMELKQQMIDTDENIKKMQQMNEQWLQQSFVRLNDITKESKQEIQKNLKIFEKDRLKKENIIENKTNTNVNTMKTELLFATKWNDIISLKKQCNNIHDKFAQLPNILAHVKDVEELGISLNEWIKKNNTQTFLVLNEWLKYQISQISIKKIFPHIRFILLTLVCRTFVQDLTWEPRLMEIQFKAEQFLRDIRINGEFTDQISNTIISWCQELANENTSAFIHISCPALLHPVYSFFEVINKSTQDMRGQFNSLIMAKSTATTRPKNISMKPHSRPWVIFALFFLGSNILLWNLLQDCKLFHTKLHLLVVLCYPFFSYLQII
ncbi:viral A-type inclusion protein [Reticulomyxa filosa]|uniref:Viral A-type inclusion protein n=1 Tax=Reticulomyxa filosa TaxID=46433 RepID=X6MY54_RETFI|nr:viral A-type inclusion protein [Reticulomyxa filosa]|eukprot:ETO18566.1 viral A-type inclusion protein [Reticulomyxa filosa]